jgi:hypothetical protein
MQNEFFGFDFYPVAEYLKLLLQMKYSERFLVDRIDESITVKKSILLLENHVLKSRIGKSR